MDDQLNYEHRFAKGVVKRVFARQIDVALDEPLMGLREVRVLGDHFPDNRKSWRIGDKVDSLFVYNLPTALRQITADRSHSPHAFASIAWSNPAVNPWDPAHPRHPVIGQIVAGIVHRSAGTSDVIVRIGDCLLEGFLNLLAVPEGRFRNSVDDLLPPGLELKAKIIEVDSRRCKIELSVLAWLADLERNQGKGPHEIGSRKSSTPYVRYVEDIRDYSISKADAVARTPAEGNALSSRWHGFGVLIVDDDVDFRRNLARWLQQFGAQSWEGDNAQRVEQLLEEHGGAITHVLVDYTLGGAQTLFAILRRLLRRSGTRSIAMVTGMVDQSVIDGISRLQRMKGAKNQPLPLIPKPLQFQAMDRWLRDSAPPLLDRNLFSPAGHWNHEAGPVQCDMANRGVPWLKAICAQAGASGAIWVRCHDPGYELVATYEILAREPLDRRADLLRMITGQLVQTVVADVEITRLPASTNLHASDPLSCLWPGPSAHVLALPMWESVEAVESPSPRPVGDVVLLFSSTPINPSWTKQTEWQALSHWWSDLIELERLQDRLLEDAVFATQGRVHSATLHEIRPILQVFQSPKRWSPEQALEWWENGQRLSRLVDGGLYNIRPERIAQVNLRQRLETLMSDFLWQFAARRFVTVIVRLPPPDLVVTLPPEVFEQPLSNLLDNATKSCQHRRWAHVTVEVLLCFVDPARPLVVRVTDQGRGMTPQERRHLFQPRHTQQGAGGFGMGLYVSQRLATAAGGQLLLLENSRWGGCVFELRLPLTWGPVAGTRTMIASE